MTRGWLLIRLLVLETMQAFVLLVLFACKPMSETGQAREDACEAVPVGKLVVVTRRHFGHEYETGETVEEQRAASLHQPS